MKTGKETKFLIDSCPACGHTGGDDYLEAPDRYHGRTTKYRLVRCPSCTLVRTYDPPSPSKIGEHYGSDYDVSVTSAGEDPRRWSGRAEVVQRYLPNGGAVLDLGCSSGGFLNSLKGPTWSRFGVEMSEVCARRAREVCGAEVFVGDILNAPFQPESFDIITGFHIFEHLYQPREVLELISRWLKPGGIFFAMMPNIDSAGAKIFKSYWYALELPRHIGHWSPVSFSRLSKSVGLEPVSVEAHREMFIESSMRYIVDRMLEPVGITRAPLSQATQPGIPFRIVRKAFRMTVLPVLTGLGGLAGDGESIHAILRKPLQDRGNAPSKAERRMVSQAEKVESN